MNQRDIGVFNRLWTEEVAVTDKEYVSFFNGYKPHKRLNIKSSDEVEEYYFERRLLPPPKKNYALILKNLCKHLQRADAHNKIQEIQNKRLKRAIYVKNSPLFCIYKLLP